MSIPDDPCSIVSPFHPATGLWLSTTDCLEKVNPSYINTPSTSIAQLSPFTPCLTPSPSLTSGSSTTSSPSIRSAFDLPLLLQANTDAAAVAAPTSGARRASIDSAASCASSNAFQQQACLSAFRPLTGLPYTQEVTSRLPQAPHKPGEEVLSRKRTRRTPPPTEQPAALLLLRPDFARVTALSPSLPSASTSAPPVVAIPPAQASDLPFDFAAKKPSRASARGRTAATRRHGASSSSSSSSSVSSLFSCASTTSTSSSTTPTSSSGPRRRGISKADARHITVPSGAQQPGQQQQHPVKFRFVSVQHSAPSGRGGRRRVQGSGSRSRHAIKDEGVSESAVTDGAEGTELGMEDDEYSDDGRVYFEEHMEEDVDEGPFEHGPTELPPKAYPGGEYAVSPLKVKKSVGKIPASNLDFLPMLEARFLRLENAIARYVALRAEQALANSILPVPAPEPSPGDA